MDRLFQAFYTTKNDGMGIGLSVSRSIIERHHGHLWAEPNDGPGPLFRFPFLRGREVHRMQDNEPRMIPISIVSVVDDDESVRESLPDLLREFGFIARSFSSAEEFLDSEYVGPTNCLILDVGMPGMSGPELQRELKLRGKHIPIVFITANRDEDVRPRVLAQGRGVPVQAVQQYCSA
jgi:CheY-like chemotaxis protein